MKTENKYEARGIGGHVVKIENARKNIIKLKHVRPDLDKVTSRGACGHSTPGVTPTYHVG